MKFTRHTKLGGAIALAMLLATGGTAALARDGARPRGAHAPRPAQPHTRTTERERTENGHTRRDVWTHADGRTATRDVVVTNDRDAGTRTRNVDITTPNGKTRSVDSVATRTDDGFTRSTTMTNTEGQTATRDLTVTRDKEAGTTSRSASYTTFGGKQGSMTDVTQRTDDGFSRETVRNLPNGETHARSVDVSCDKDVGKCVKQVEVDGGTQPN